MYCKNNPIIMSDTSGFRPTVGIGGRETPEDMAASLATMSEVNWNRYEQREQARMQFAQSQMKDLGYRRWRYRRDTAKEETRENEHIHLEGNGKKFQQDINGNRRKLENKDGDPPRGAKDALKEREGWDWDENAQKATEKKIAIGGAAIGFAYLTYRATRMIPSLAPPLWWTIPGNLVIP